MQGIPQDLISDILLRLPVKSICRFKCVSKPWWSLLSSPSFAKAHLKLHIRDPEDLIFTVPSSEQPLRILTFTAESSSNDGIVRMVNFPIKTEEASIEVGASGNGLVLLLLKGKDECRTVLMNPITLEAVEVPHRPDAKNCTYGMCFDSFKDDYSIVSISSKGTMDTYSVKVKTWRRLANFPHDAVGPAPGAFLNGRMHWMARSGSQNVNSGWLLAAFNLTSEEFEEVPLPSHYEFNAIYTAEIRVFEGCLVLVYESCRGCLEVWMMKEYGVQDSWTKLSTMTQMSGRNSLFEVICLLSEEIVLGKNGLRLVSINRRNCAWRRMDIADFPDDYRGVQTFRGSLLSPN